MPRPVQKVWEKDTLIDHDHSYTITGAPRVFNGKVLIGEGGAEFGARGYVTAYDAETGKQLWRWFTVPGDPSKPFEDAAMETAAKTWTPASSGQWRRRHAVGRHHLRSRAEPGLHRHRQRRAVEPQAPQSRPAATISTLPRSSRWTPTPANTSGTTRKRPAITGTTPRPSR